MADAAGTGAAMAAQGPSVRFHVTQAVMGELRDRGLPTAPGGILGGITLRFTPETLDQFLVAVQARLVALGRTYAYDNALATAGLLISVGVLIIQISRVTT